MHAGAGAYICGEETALLDSLEGNRGQPRLKPPFPAIDGLYASPTVVNNVDTLATVPVDPARRRGLVQGARPEKSARHRPSTRCPGTSSNPGQYEAPMGTTLRELLDLAGGMSRGNRLKFWTPGGSSTPMLTEEHLDVPLDFDTVGAAGSMHGT